MTTWIASGAAHGDEIRAAAREYAEEVRQGRYPDHEFESGFLQRRVMSELWAARLPPAAVEQRTPAANDEG